ncbi:glycosyltransferase family 4 protein [Bradyrhizobium sp. 15]|uniref:glycosyltransferase family 4 protein n=1 Tax=Bradyrhizobium sp. 15 TaxID=2782633 RepID=UPI001FFB445D|nr:glycosyltransferase family 4 protein [Bradyrhizobium sp. 15]MCK1434942.1 glycosyltransferase family 4 protein [Bradyrhizobium sp. 15]
MTAARVGVFHPGTQHSWQTARALQQLGMLEWYTTSIYYQPDRWPYKATKYLPNAIRQKLISEFKRFYHPDLDSAYVRTHGAHEWMERILARAKWRGTAAWVNSMGNRSFGRELGRLIEFSKPDVVWGYDSSSKEGFEVASSLGLRRILDVTIGDPRLYNQLMSEVYEQYKEFFVSKNFLIGQDRIDRLDEEYDLASTIVVGSEFCSSSLTRKNVRPDLSEKIRILNYCFDDIFFALPAAPLRKRDKSEPINFLFLGQAGPRKGVHLFLKAIERIPRKAANFKIVGDLQVPVETFSRFQERVSVVNAVSRPEVKDALLEADCLIFPTYFEGAGIVLYEALACGVAVIQSKNADLAVTPETGLVLDQLTENGLYAAMMALIEDRDLLLRFQQAAPHRAEQYSFARYRSGIESILRESP